MDQHFDYYYGNQADQFSFIRIPRVMLTDNAFSSLSIQAKVLYGVLLDRMSLSRKNAWFDGENRVFIIYQIGEIQQDLGFTKKKAMDLLSELEKFGLLEKKRRGHGLPNILYVKSFMTGNTATDTSVPTRRQPAQAKTVSRSDENVTSGLFSPDSRSPETSTSRSANMGTLEVTESTPQEVSLSAPQEVRFSGPLKSHTENNQTERNHIESNHIYGWMAPGSRKEEIRFDEMRSDDNPVAIAREYRALIRENIEFDDLLRGHPGDRDLIEGIAELILETVLCRTEYILIASNSYPAEIVKSKFLKLGYWHIEYVLNCLQTNTTKVRNIKKYLLAALFNAPSTIEPYYTAEVNHDMQQTVNR